MNIPILAFRFRYGLHALILGMGYFAPWNRWLHLDHGRTLWLLLAGILGKTGWMTFDQSTVALLFVTVGLALTAATLRTWASAYLGIATVQDEQMRSNFVITAGPYRYLRNPLYLGTMLHTLALAMLMPPSGAIFAIALIGFLQFVLIASEEGLLLQAHSATYFTYRGAVPSFFPAFVPKLPVTETKGDWSSAFMGEIYMWGVALSFLLLGWRYNALLIMQGVLISLGLSLILRAFPVRRNSS